MSDSTPRPSHTTMAAGMVIGGSVLVVLTVAQQLAGLSSLQTRESVAGFLAQQPGSSLGIDVTGALALLRVALMVVAGCATAAVVLGVHVLRRSRPARLGLTVLAVPLFLGGLATGGFLTSLVAAASTLLWIGPSSAWLERRPIPEAPRRTEPSSRTTPWPPPPPPPDDSANDSAGDQPPPPFPPPGQAPAPFPTLGQAPPQTYAGGPPRRPDVLLWACVITWAFCGLTLAVVGASLAVLLADPGVVWTELQRQDPQLAESSGLSREALIDATFVTMAVGAVWSLVGIALAVLTYRGSGGARIGLVVCASAAAVVCLVVTLGSAVMLVPAGACLATVALLVRPEARAWSAARRRPSVM